MLARVHSAAIFGIDAIATEIEVDTGTGGFEKSTIVGLPDTAVKESIERVRSAIHNCGYPYPATASVINLAPADLKKEGPSFDLPIALAFLFGQGAVQSDNLDKTVVIGELALDGRVRPVKGALAAALMAKKHNFTTLLLPAENALEAAVVQELDVIPIASLSQAVGFLTDQLPLTPASLDLDAVFNAAAQTDLDFADVKGQESVKRALTIAAAGNHNLLMIGPPGAGKTMLTKRLPTILPPLTLDESLETTRIHSALGLLKNHHPLLATRPVRTPHHSASAPSLVGGGTIPRPGELSLAHNGLLFLDEFPEFSRTVLETIRQPLEDGHVTISRAAGTLTFPANIMLVAAMNPCPCGYLTDPKRRCRCTPLQVQKYLAKLSGPLLDRIDIHVEVPAVPFRQLSDDRDGTSSAVMRSLVLKARQGQHTRFADLPIKTNARMSSRHIRKFCPLDTPCRQLLHQAVSELGLSARAHDKVLKLARTIADLDQSADLQPQHLAEAIQYRRLDRNL